MGGRAYKSTNYFSPGDCNTICDRTGFKVKMSGVKKEWTGYFVIPEAHNERHPQDFPVTPTTQKVFPDSRKGDND